MTASSRVVLFIRCVVADGRQDADTYAARGQRLRAMAEPGEQALPEELERRAIERQRGEGREHW